MILMAINSPGALDWWERNGASVYPDEFCDYVVRRLPEVKAMLSDGVIY
jgi:hypothetical protein